MAKRKNFMGDINRRHRDMSAAQINSPCLLLMQQQIAILNCHCGHHCISRTGLLMHFSRCQVPRPEDWGIPPRHPRRASPLTSATTYSSSRSPTSNHQLRRYVVLVSPTSLQSSSHVEGTNGHNRRSSSQQDHLGA